MFLCQQGQGLPVNALLSEDLVWGRCLSGPEYGTALPTLWGRAGWCPQIRCKGPPMQFVGVTSGESLSAHALWEAQH